MYDKSLLETKNLSFAYPDGTLALTDVNCTITKGEAIAILGENGAGKTTLLKHFVGLLQPTQGELYIMGKPASKRHLKEIRQRVGFVFQNPDDQLFAPTVFEDVAFGPFNLKLSETEVRKRAESAMQKVGVAHLRDRLIHNLSGGEKKRVSIAGVLAMEPDVLILDEPTAGLDPKGAEELILLLNQLRKTRELTLVISTHDIDRVPLYADRAYVMHRGKIELSGSLREVFSQTSRLKEYCLCPPIVTQLFLDFFAQQGWSSDQLPLTLNEAKQSLRQLLGSPITHERR